MWVKNAEHALCNHHVFRDVHYPCVCALAYTPRLPLVLANTHSPTAHLCAACEHDCRVTDMARTSYSAPSRGWSCVRLGVHTTNVRTLDAWTEPVWPLGRGFGTHVYPHLDLQYTSLKTFSSVRIAWRAGRADEITTEKRATTEYCSAHFFALSFPFPFPFPFPNDLPSNPGRALSFPLPLPFAPPFRRSAREAMLSVRFFWRAAMLVATCSLRSSHVFMLFVFCFSLRFTAFFSRASSSCTFVPSTRAPAFSHCSRSARAARSASGSAASLSLCFSSCESACEGLDALIGRFFLIFEGLDEVEALRLEKVTEVNLDWGS